MIILYSTLIGLLEDSLAEMARFSASNAPDRGQAPTMMIQAYADAARRLMPHPEVAPFIDADDDDSLVWTAEENADELAWEIAQG